MLKSAEEEIRPGESRKEIVDDEVKTSHTVHVTPLMQARGPRRDSLHAAIRKAKRDWAMDIIQRTNQTEVWSLCNWASGLRHQCTPPIRHGDVLATNPQSQGVEYFVLFILHYIITLPTVQIFGVVFHSRLR